MLWNQHLVKHCENKLHCSTNWQRLKPLQDATFLQRSNISTRRKTPKELYWLFTFGSIFFRTGFQPKVVLNWVYSAVKWVWILHELPSTLSANHRLCQPIPARRHYWSQNDKRKSHSQAIHAEVKTSFLRPIEDLYLFDKKAFCMDYHGEHISIEWQVVSTQYSYLYIDIYIYIICINISWHLASLCIIPLTGTSARQIEKSELARDRFSWGLVPWHHLF